MNFSREGRTYTVDELKGTISNNFTFSIKDLYKREAHRITAGVYMLDCLDCGMYLSCDDCLFCGSLYDEGIDGKVVKNQTTQRPCDVEEKSVECMILMVDLSGSMNFTYPSVYRKLNATYMERSIGAKNYEVLRRAIGEDEIIRNFKSIETLLESGESVRDIALSFREELEREKKAGRLENRQEEIEYISRKEIIEIGVAQYIQTIKTRRPNTIITVVYFNSHIEYPVNDFGECKVVGDLEGKTLEDMVALGK